MANPIQAAEENHYLWGGGCDGWRLVRNPELSVIEERMPPAAEEQRHFHNRSRQFFYVLEGELTMEVEEIEHLLKVHDGVEIAPGEKHKAKNLSAADVRFLVISQPQIQNDRELA
jgi:quercetin dioxygenase-like cupin family protein